MSSNSMEMNAVVTTGDGKTTLARVPVPKAQSGQVLIRVIAAAQNPSEWMSITRNITKGVGVGHDFAGIVEEIGPDVQNNIRFIGERVAGFIRGGYFLDEGGSFAEYIITDARMVIPIPDTLPFEDAAGVGLCALTACQALWQVDRGLPTPENPTKDSIPILVWGGASALGQYTIQLCKLSGMQVITTASPKNFDLVRSLGATGIFDYRDEQVSAKIKSQWTSLKHAVDCIATEQTLKQVSDAMSDTEEGYIAMALGPDTSVVKANIKAEFALVHTLLGKEMALDWITFPSNPRFYALGQNFCSLLAKLLKQGVLRTTPVKLVPNGLKDVQEWIQYQMDGKISAEKITYRIADTPK